MKKFLIVMLVLALTSMANAAVLELLVGGSSTVADGAGTVTVDLVSPDITVSAIGGAGAGDLDIIASSGLAIPTVGTFGAVSSLIGFMQPAGFALNVGAIVGPDIIGISGGADAGKEAGLGDVLYSFTINIPGGSVGETLTPFMGGTDYVMSLTTSPMFWAGSSLTLNPLTVVPEPMTIALLGLGGLFLRRRK